MTAISPPLIDQPGLATAIRRDPEAVLDDCAATHGPVFTVAVDADHRITYVLDPHLFRPLLTAPQVDFAPVSRQSKRRFGLGRMVATQDRTRRLSHAIVGGLRGAQLAETLTAFEAELDHASVRYAATVDTEQARSVQSLARETLMPATVHALFGDGVYDEQFVHDFEAFSEAVATRLAGSCPDLDERGVAAQRALKNRLRGPLRRMDTPALDALSDRLLSDATVTDDERLSTLIMLMWGSMVNLVPTSVWMYASLLSHPRLVAELRHTADTRSGESLRRSIVTETLRLFSRPNMYRAVREDFDLRLHDARIVHFAEGDWVALFPRLLHHDPEVFADPLRFDPWRFCPEDGEPHRPPTFAKGGIPLTDPVVVFGQGRGRCPGDAYTVSVLDRLLTRWTSTFEARLVDAVLPPAVTETVSSTPSPASDIDMIIRARTSAPG